MKTSNLATYRFGEYVITEWCDRCGKPHAASSALMILHVDGEHELISAPTRKPPRELLGRYSRWCSRQINAMSRTIKAHATEAMSGVE